MHAWSGRTLGRGIATASVAALGVLSAWAPVRGQQGAAPPAFKAGVEVVNVTATVVDRSGRFVPGLGADDFIVYEDNVRQAVSQFSADRVPVSLGIALDTSGSMMGEKIEAARAALNRFLFDLLGDDDEIFLYQFSDTPRLLEGWTKNRQALGRELGRMQAHGGTAIYDTLMEALPLARSGQHTKKAVLLISDGNDTSSAATVSEVRDRLRSTEVLLYAIGIDGDPDEGLRAPFRPRQPRIPPRPRSPFPPNPRGPRPPFGIPLFPQRAAGAQFQPGTPLPQANDQRRGAPGADRRQRRPYRDHPQPARSGAGNRRHCRRTEQAVLPRIHVDQSCTRRPVAVDPRRTPQSRLPRPRAKRLSGELRSASSDPMPR
jgi:Mg-chelatase subunit ChlD